MTTGLHLFFLKKQCIQKLYTLISFFFFFSFCCWVVGTRSKNNRSLLLPIYWFAILLWTKWKWINLFHWSRHRFHIAKKCWFPFCSWDKRAIWAIYISLEPSKHSSWLYWRSEEGNESHQHGHFSSSMLWSYCIIWVKGARVKKING